MPLKLMSWLLVVSVVAILGLAAFAESSGAPPGEGKFIGKRPSPATKPVATKPAEVAPPVKVEAPSPQVLEKAEALDFMSMVFVFMLATFIGIGVIMRVSRLLHTPLMSLTNAISAIAVVGSIIVAGGRDYPTGIRVLGAIALFCSMTNIISGFLITDRMLKMFKVRPGGKA